jgi:hypothetical protein
MRAGALGGVTAFLIIVGLLHLLDPTGSYVRRRKDIDEPEPQDGYVVDVSVQGVKVKLESDVNGEFVDDGDLVPYHEAQTIATSNRADPMCPSLHECRAVNWCASATATPIPSPPRLSAPPRSCHRKPRCSDNRFGT